MPHPADRTARPEAGRAAATPFTTPGASAGRQATRDTPAAAEALDHVLAATDLVHDARAVARRAAAERHEAVLTAHRAGASVRRIAAALGVTGGAVQHMLASAGHGR